MKIGPHSLAMPVLLAPMAGITDLPFRQAVRQFGVGMTVAEMVSAKPELKNSRKSKQRNISVDEPLPRAIQIVGNDPREMANAAAIHEGMGAGIIDINMGCPAKKVCKKAAGSALLGDENRVQEIIKAVVGAVSVPVTVKIRTGLTRTHNNAVNIARIAQSEGAQSLVVHGRSRACLFKGEAEYDTIRRVKLAVSIPVVANGDIDSPTKAAEILRQTGADAVMVGRSAQGQPWLPMMIGNYLGSLREEALQPPDLLDQKQACLNHIGMVHEFYGEDMGVRISRKHIRCYLAQFSDGAEQYQAIVRMEGAKQVLAALEAFYDWQCEKRVLSYSTLQRLAA